MLRSRRVFLAKFNQLQITYGKVVLGDGSGSGGGARSRREASGRGYRGIEDREIEDRLGIER